VGITPIFPPMIFKQGDELAGVEVDLAKALGKHLNRPVTFVELPWEDQIDALNKGRTDIIMSSMSVTVPRKFLVDFSTPYFTVSQMALVRTEDRNDYLLGFPADLKGPIGVLKATTGDFLVQQNFPKTKRVTLKNGDEAARALIRKKVELFITDSPTVWYLSAQHAVDGLSVVPIFLSEEPLAWAVKKGDEGMLTTVNDFITAAGKDGTIKKAFTRWTAIGN
jgi:polar amino acid transport system substrate-binding protein